MKQIKLILARFDKLKKRDKALALLLIGAILFNFYFNGFYRPNIAKIRRLKSALASVNSQIAKVKKQTPDIDSLKYSLRESKRRYDNLRKEVDFLESQLPTQARVPQLLGELVAQAQGLSVDFISVRPKQAKQKEYAYLEIELKINSDYPNLTSYLNRLENFSQFLNVGQVSVAQMRKESAFEANTTLLLSALLGEDAREEKPKEEAPLAGAQDALPLARNPFISNIRPGKEAQKEKEYVLNGITLRGKKSTAIINNEIYRIGDTIGNKTVKQIVPNMVILNDGKQDIILLVEM